MTPSDYIAAGYEMSAQKAQAEITRAESDVTRAYVYPIIPNAQTTDADVKRAVMSLAFLQIVQRNIFATRGGARLKTGASSTQPSGDAILQQMAHECHEALEVLRGKAGANKDAKVDDVLRIYFSSNYFYTL